MTSGKQVYTLCVLSCCDWLRDVISIACCTSHLSRFVIRLCIYVDSLRLWIPDFEIAFEFSSFYEKIIWIAFGLHYVPSLILGCGIIWKFGPCRAINVLNGSYVSLILHTWIRKHNWVSLRILKGELGGPRLCLFCLFPQDLRKHFRVIVLLASVYSPGHTAWLFSSDSSVGRRFPCWPMELYSVTLLPIRFCQRWRKKISVEHFLTMSRNVGWFTSPIVGVRQCDRIGWHKKIGQGYPGLLVALDLEQERACESR